MSEPLRIANDGELVYRCPYCADRSGHLHANPELGLWHCYRCSRGGRIAWINKDFPHLQIPDESGFDSGQDELVGQQDWATFFRRVRTSMSGILPPVTPVPDQNSSKDFQRKIIIEGHVNSEDQERIGLGRGTCIPILTTAWQVKIPPTPPIQQLWQMKVAQLLARHQLPLASLRGWDTMVPLAGSRIGRLVFPAFYFIDPANPLRKELTWYSARALEPPPYSKIKYLGPPQQTVGNPGSRWLPGPLARQYLAGRFLGNDGVGYPDLVLVEGAFDAVAVEYHAGVPAVAMLGKLPGRNLDLYLLLRQLKSRVMVLLDSDCSCMDSQRAAGRLRRLGILATVPRQQLPAGYDPGDCPADLLRAALLTG